MREKLRNFMSGRYGSDNLSRFLLVVSIILIVASYILQGIAPDPVVLEDGTAKGGVLVLIANLVLYAALALLIWNMVRTMSRNIQKRYEQNQKYLRIKNDVLDFFKNLFGKGDKTHKIYRCPACKQKVRVPKGKGRIAITCPKCKSQFIKKT